MIDRAGFLKSLLGLPFIGKALTRETPQETPEAAPAPADPLRYCGTETGRYSHRDPRLRAQEIARTETRYGAGRYHSARFVVLASAADLDEEPVAVSVKCGEYTWFICDAVPTVVEQNPYCAAELRITWESTGPVRIQTGPALGTRELIDVVDASVTSTDAWTAHGERIPTLGLGW